jgi:hypothetical protein
MCSDKPFQACGNIGRKLRLEKIATKSSDVGEND